MDTFLRIMFLNNAHLSNIERPRGVWLTVRILVGCESIAAFLNRRLEEDRK